MGASGSDTWTVEPSSEPNPEGPGVERTVVVTYSENLFAGQVQGLTMHLNKAVKALKELQQRLLSKGAARGGKPITRASLSKQVKTALSAQFLSDMVRYEISEDQDPPQSTYTIDRDALRQLEDRSFGKTILFTDQQSEEPASEVACSTNQGSYPDNAKGPNRA